MRRLINVTLMVFILLNTVFVTSSTNAAPLSADRGPWAPNVSYAVNDTVTYNGVTKAHYFTVGCPGSLTLSGVRASSTGAISGGSITSTETMSSTVNNVEYQAELHIQLNPGFHAPAGAEFLARRANCTVGGTRQARQE